MLTSKDATPTKVASFDNVCNMLDCERLVETDPLRENDLASVGYSGLQTQKGSNERLYIYIYTERERERFTIERLHH